MHIYTCSFLGALFFIAFHTLDTQFDGPFWGYPSHNGRVDSARLQDNLQLLKDVEAGTAFRGVFKVRSNSNCAGQVPNILGCSTGQGRLV